MQRSERPKAPAKVRLPDLFGRCAGLGIAVEVLRGHPFGDRAGVGFGQMLVAGDHGEALVAQDGRDVAGGGTAHGEIRGRRVPQVVKPKVLHASSGERRLPGALNSDRLILAAWSKRVAAAPGMNSPS